MQVRDKSSVHSLIVSFAAAAAAAAAAPRNMSLDFEPVASDEI
jgi:hypothetical protein